MQWSSKSRKSWVGSYVSYAITVALEEAGILGILNNEEILWYFQEIGSKTDLLGLLPRRLSDPAGLQHQIRKQIRGLSKVPRSQDMHTCAIVHRDVGHTIPEDIRKHLLSSAKVIGLAVVNTEDGLVDILSFKEDLANSLALAEKEFSGMDCIYAFQNLPEGEIHEDDIQPFVLAEENFQDDKGVYETKPTMVCFMDGGFAGYHKKDSPALHSNAFFAFNGWLKEEVQAIREEEKGDINNVLKIMSGKRFINGITNICVPRGCVLFVCSVGGENGRGRIWLAQNNNLWDKKFDWGWMSWDQSQYPSVSSPSAQSASATVHPPGGSKMSPIERFRIAKQDQLKDALKDAPTETAAITLPVDANRLIKPPPKKLKESTDKIKGWYRYHFGKNCKLPARLEDGLPYAMLEAHSPIRIQAESGNTALTDALIKAKDLGDDIDDTIQTSSTPKIPAPSQKGAVVSEPLMLVGPKLKETLIKDILPKMTLDDPTKINLDSSEEEQPFLDQVGGYAYDDMILWDKMSWLEFARAGNGEAAAILLFQMTRDLFRTDETLRALIIEKFKETHKTEETKPKTLQLSPLERFKQSQAAKAAAAGKVA